jgi:hypothetical protein
MFFLLSEISRMNFVESMTHQLVLSPDFDVMGSRLSRLVCLRGRKRAGFLCWHVRLIGRTYNMDFGHRRAMLFRRECGSKKR